MSDSVKLIANNKRLITNILSWINTKPGFPLAGTEVKSIRMGHCSIKEAYVEVQHGEVFIIGMHISPYEKETSSIRIRCARGSC